jgi:hypothetical protein
VVTDVDAPRSWIDESKLPGLRMVFEHVIEPRGDGCTVTERARISGPLAPIVFPFIQRRMEALLRASAAHVGSR